MELSVVCEEVCKRNYQLAVVAWEKEGAWAGKPEGMTLAALRACNTGAMWEVDEPTPLTREYLIEEGYMND
mgnify:CR=1 FL=1